MTRAWLLGCLAWLGGVTSVPGWRYTLTKAAIDLRCHFIQISSLQDDIRAFNDNVARIGDLHSRSLNNMDDASTQKNNADLDELVEETSALSSTLKRRIKALEAQGAAGRDGQVRKQQVRACGVVCAWCPWGLLVDGAIFYRPLL